MKAEIKSIVSPDVEDLENYTPSSENDFIIGIEMIIGPPDINGGEIFQFSLCTPKYVHKKLLSEDTLLGRGYIFVNEYSYQTLYEKLCHYVNSMEDDTWEALATKLNRAFLWEFEDYDGGNG